MKAEHRRQQADQERQRRDQRADQRGVRPSAPGRAGQGARATPSRPLFNLMLRLNRFGRMALSREDLVASLKDINVGGVTDPIKTGDGYQILRVDSRTPAGTAATFNENRVREAMLMEVRGAVDSQGNVIAWDYHVWTPTHSSRPNASGGSLLGGSLAGISAGKPSHSGADRNANHTYDFQNNRVMVHWLNSSPIRASALRGLGSPQNTFANESFMDELAALTIAARRRGRDERGRVICLDHSGLRPAA